MNIKKMNLNLMQALDALLTEAHVTRAAQKLYITQSAMSNTLNQLRELLEDPLLVRGPNGMVLTPKAENLQPRLHQLIHELQQLVTPQPSFDAAQSKRVFRLGMSDIAEFLLLPEIFDRIESEAPHIKLEIQHVNHIESLHPFTNNQIELACGCLIDDTPHISKEKCLEFGAVVIGKKNHPLLQKPITLKDYLAAKQIRVKYHAKNVYTNLDQTLSKMNKKRNTVLTLAHILPILFMVRSTDLIASIPDCFSKKIIKHFKLAIQPVPFKVPAKYSYTAWQRQNDNDPGLLWLRNIIRETVDKIHKDKVSI